MTNVMIASGVLIFYFERERCADYWPSEVQGSYLLREVKAFNWNGTGKSSKITADRMAFSQGAFCFHFERDGCAKLSAHE